MPVKPRTSGNLGLASVGGSLAFLAVSWRRVSLQSSRSRADPLQPFHRETANLYSQMMVEQTGLSRLRNPRRHPPTHQVYWGSSFFLCCRLVAGRPNQSWDQASASIWGSEGYSELPTLKQLVEATRWTGFPA